MYSTLIVDDDEKMRDEVQHFLQTSGINVSASEAVDGEDGYHKAQNGYYDLFILDLNMPKLNGYELAVKLRAIDKYEKTPIMIYTTDHNMELIKKIRAMGRAIWCIKPMEAHNFAQALDVLLNGVKPKLKASKA
jgi:two-component system chemotaxis response regulator CheY